MDLRKLKTLIDLISESNIAELEITEAEGKVRIVKGGYAPAPTPMAGALAPQPQTMLAAAPPATPLAAEAVIPAEPKTIKSPMVGTFYRAATPGANAFAEVGDTVKPGQPVCIIEAMKIMNEIEADIEGKILRVLCENGQPVEFGQPLFALE